MGILTDSVRAAVSRVVFGTAPWTPSDTAALEAGDPAVVFGSGLAVDVVEGMSAGELYETQPNLRTAVDFSARNAAQLGRHVYRPDGDGGRERASDSFLEKLLKSPNDYQSGFDLFKQLFAELALYDFHLWMIDNSRQSGGTTITPIPTEWIINTKTDAFGRVTHFYVKPAGAAKGFELEAKDAVVFRGYSPHGYKKGSPAVHSLKSILSEQIAAADFRKQMWKRGGRIGMYLTRPADAPEWSQEGKAKFIQQWKAQWSGGGSEAGGTPLLDEGMEMKRVGFNAKEEQWAEGAQLALVTVAQAFHIPPAMLGASGYNSFASVKEFRKMLYTETLGPSVAQVEDTINTFLIPKLGIRDGSYLELNIGEKLQGDFEEQGNVLFQAVGGPYMAPNEARKRMNMPAIEGGDELLTPLNMGAAGNSGPVADEEIAPEAPGKAGPDATTPVARKSSHGAQNDDGTAFSLKSDSDTLAAELKAYFKRQRTVVGRALSGKAPEWWDAKRWNNELSSILQPHMIALTATTAREAAKAKGLDPNEYSIGRTSKFLAAVADSRADLINATTRDQIAKQLANDVAGDEAVAHVFDVAEEARAKESASTMTTMLKAWAVVEMATQLVPDKRPTKTWVSSGLPNSRHADMNGETVPIDEKFSNGAMWPGDPELGASEVANCGCGVDINYKE